MVAHIFSRIMVFSLPLKSPGIFSVTPCWSMMIFEGKIRFPSATREAMNVSMEMQGRCAICFQGHWNFSALIESGGNLQDLPIYSL